MADVKALSPREALDTFKEYHPDLNTLEQILAIPEAQFVETYSSFFGGDPRKARTAYREAQRVAEQATLLWVNIRETLSPAIQGTLFNNVDIAYTDIPTTFIEHQQQIPEYERLFGNLDFIECEHCRSIFGPAAYFVDLMRFIEKHIPQAEIAASLPGHQLAGRQPRLFHLPLDCENTYNLVPYIDLVNEVLEDLVRSSEAPDPYAAVEMGLFPSQLPFHLPLSEIRIYLQQLKLSLQEIYSLFGVIKPEIARELLTLSPREYALVEKPAVSKATLNQLYGVADVAATGKGSLEDVTVFMAQTDLSRDELDKLLFSDLSESEMQAGLSRLFFINNTGDQQGHLVIEPVPIDPDDGYDRIANLTLAKLDRIYRFLKLSRKLGWSFADLDWALRSLQGSTVSEPVLRFDGVNDYVVISPTPNALPNPTSFTLEAWVLPSESGVNPIVAKGLTDGSNTQFLLWISPQGKVSFLSQISSSGILVDLDWAKYTATVNGISGVNLSSDRTLPLGVFSHLAVTVDEAVQDYYQLKFYINGVLDSTYSFAQPINSQVNGAEIYIGKDFFEEFFSGSITDVRLWDGIRTADEIAQNRFERCSGQETNLIAYWPLNESASLTVCDHAIASDGSTNRYPGRLGGDSHHATPVWVQADLALTPLPAALSPYAYHFNGRDQYVGGTVPSDNLTRLTLEAVVDIAQSGTHPIATHGSSANNTLQYQLTIGTDGKLIFNSADLSQPITSTEAVAVNAKTHVAVVLTAKQLTFYINGDKAGEFPTSAEALTAAGEDFYLAHDFNNQFLAGTLQEIRLWNIARSQDELNAKQQQQLVGSEAGLIGYWRLDEPNPQTAATRDYTFNQNHLTPGGSLVPYQPTPTTHPEVILPTPVDQDAFALTFAAGQHPVKLENQQRFGLGKGELFTLQFWFKASEPANAERKQVLITQGDLDSGLTVYLLAGELYVYAWRAEFGGATLKAEVELKASGITVNRWHHFTFVYDELADQDITYQLYLDGQQADQTTEKVRLDQVGDAYLGGIDAQNIDQIFARFHSATPEHESHYFVGQITDLRLWQTALSETAVTNPDDRHHPRHTPPLTTPDLLCYLPLTEGYGRRVSDPVGPEYADDTDRDPTILDQSPHTLNGELFVGPEASADKWQTVSDLPIPRAHSALYLDGKDDHVALPDVSTLKLDQDFTVEAWIKPAASAKLLPVFGTVTPLATTESTMPADTPVLCLGIKAGRPYASWGEAQLHPSTLLDSASWHHIAWQYDAAQQTLQIVLNGQPLPETGTFAPFTGMGNAAIGRCHQWNPVEQTFASLYFAGSISEVRLWHTVRSVAELGQYQQRPLPGSQTILAALTAYWIFDDRNRTLIPSRETVSNNLYQLVSDSDFAKAQPIWQPISDHPIWLNPLTTQALAFDGERQFLATNELVLPTRNLTVSAWVNVTDLQSSRPVIWWGNAEASAELRISTAGKLEAYVGDSPAVATSTATIPAGEFVNVAIAIQSTHSPTDQPQTQITLFINGEASGSDTTAQALPSGNFLWRVGRGAEGSLGYFKGQMQAVRVWQTALDAAALQPTLYHPIAANAADLIAAWPLAEVEPSEIKQPEINESLYTPNLVTGSPQLKLGGIASRKPTAGTPTEFLDARRQVLTLPAAPATLPMPALGTASYPHRAQHTIEVWFLCNNLFTATKQTIYAEDEGDRTLSLYIQSGSLFFEGFNRPTEQSNWQGSLIQTDRIQAGRWHHAVLVLDGRAEIRDNAMCALLDGKVIDTKPGAQLWGQAALFNIGGLKFTLPAADAESNSIAITLDETLLQGQIKEVRVWSTVLSSETLLANREIAPTAGAANLLFYLNTETLPVSILAPLQLPDPRETNISNPQIPLENLAYLRRLQTDTHLPINQLSALFSSLKHTGTSDGRTLYDDIINPTGTPANAYWSYAQRQRWEISSTSNEARAIRTRLMSALRVASTDLDQMVLALSGQVSTVIVDGGYLTLLYRLRLLTTLLAMPVNEVVRLIEIMRAETKLTATPLNALPNFTLTDVQQLITRSQEMREMGIDLSEYEFLAYDRQDSRVSVPYSEATVVDMATTVLNQAGEFLLTATTLRNQAGEFLLTPSALASEEISQTAAGHVYDALVQRGAIARINLTSPAAEGSSTTTVGVVLSTFSGLLEADLLLIAAAMNWPASFEDLYISSTALRNANLIDLQGRVIPTDPSAYSVDALIPLATDPNPDRAKLAQVRDLLESRRQAQTNLPQAITAQLNDMRRGLEITLQTVLADLLETDTDQLLPILTHTTGQLYAQGKIDPVAFLQHISQIANQRSLSESDAIARDLYQLNKTLFLLSQFAFNEVETAALLSTPAIFGLQPASLLNPSHPDLWQLHTFGTLKTDLGDPGDQLVQVLQGTLAIEAFGQRVNWPYLAILTLSQRLNISPDAINTIPNLSQLAQAFALVATLGSDADYLADLANTGVPNYQSFSTYQRHAQVLYDLVRAKYSDEQWQRVYQPIHDLLAIQKRDSLTAVARETLKGRISGRISPDLLYEYLLIDVQTGSEVQTSRIVQAIAALQLYVQRGLMNLEAGVQPENIPADEWEWMKNYRVWEANRKVFLYPENYIEPQLRDTKTPLFQALEEELLQTDLNQDTAQVAYTRYLDKFAEVTNLTIVGSYLNTDSLSANSTYTLQFKQEGGIALGDVRPLLPKTFTIEMWVKHNQPDNLGGALIGQWNNANQPSEGWFVNIVNGDLLFAIATSNTTTFADVSTSGSKLAPNRWYHLAFTYSGSEIAIYIDGKKANRTPVSGDINYPSDTNFMLGAFKWNDDPSDAFRFRGEMSEVRIWNVARSEAEIRASRLYGIANPMAETNLVRYWKLDEGQGTTAADSSSAGQALDFDIALAWTSTALQFKQEGGIALGDVRPLLPKTFTVEMWVKHNQPDNLGGALIGQWNNANQPSEGWFVNIVNDDLLFAIATSDTTTFADVSTSGSKLAPNRWYHLAFTYSGSEIAIYIDGKKANRTPVSGDINYPSDTNFMLGAFKWNDDPSDAFRFRGEMSEVRIWNVARREAEIRASRLYGIANPMAETNLVRYWKLDEGQGTTAADSSSAGQALDFDIALAWTSTTWTSTTWTSTSLPELILNQDFGGKTTLYWVGRNDATQEYYFRELINGNQWQPWKKIDLTINADFVSPVFAFNKLFLFWAEISDSIRSEDRRWANAENYNELPVDQLGKPIKLKENPGEGKINPTQFDGDLQEEIIDKVDGGTINAATKVYSSKLDVVEQMNITVKKPVIKYAYYNFSQVWTQPQVYEALDVELEEWQQRQPKWLRVYAQRWRESQVAPPVPPEPVLRENVQVAQLGPNSYLEQTIDTFNMDELTISFWLQVNDIAPQTAIEPISPHTFTLFSYGNNALRATLAHQPGPIEQQSEIVTAAVAAEAVVSNYQQGELELILKVGEAEPVNLLANLSDNSAFRYGAWYHLAMVLRHTENQYTATVYLYDREAASYALDGDSFVFEASVLPRGQTLSLGQADNPASIAPDGLYQPQISEFRLWDFPRARAAIDTERSQRKHGKEVGLRSHLPLHRQDFTASLPPAPDTLRSPLPLHRQNPVAAEVTLVSSTLPLTEVSAPVIPDSNRERIVLLYGNIIRTLRNNLKDIGNQYTLQLNSGAADNYDLSLGGSQQTASALVGIEPDSRISTEGYAATHALDRFKPADRLAVLNGNPALLSTAIVEWHENAYNTPLLQNLQGGTQLNITESYLLDVNNQPGWSILDIGDEIFLVKIKVSDQNGSDLRLLTSEERLRSEAASPTGASNQFNLFYERDPALEIVSDITPKFEFVRLNTFAVHTLSERLFGGGIDGLLSLDSQNTNEPDFALLADLNNPQIIGPNQTGSTVDNKIDFKGAYGLYYEEIFFHIPFLIANQLNANQQFAEAQQWYHYIFNPTAQETSQTGQPSTSKDRYWRYRPFRNLSLDTLVAIMSDATALETYRKDPFDPHAIARLRLNTYQKSIVMKYIDNLLDWGDFLFRQDTRESIGEAVPLYVLAYNLLGERPQLKQTSRRETVGSYTDVKADLGTQQLPDFLTDLTPSAASSPSPETLYTPNRIVLTRFCVPENAHFLGYWDRVEDRLYKIRHSLNIDGVFRSLALFQPPIDPAALVSAVAGGGLAGGLGDAIAASNISVPHYRYSFMLDKAKEMTDQIIELGGALLNALDNQDEAALSRLQHTQELAILKRISAIKQLQIDEANANREALKQSLLSAQERSSFYQGLMDAGLLNKEISQMALMGIATGLKTGAAIANTTAAAFASIPEIEVGGSGFGGSPVATVKSGGPNGSKLYERIGTALEISSEILSETAGILGIRAGYERREQEWTHEKVMTDLDIAEINHQLTANAAQITMATQDLQIHEQTIAHHQEVGDFNQRKFTSGMLYSWMSNRLSGLYFQAYKLAFDLAKQAERAFQFEFGVNDTYINFGYWDSRRKGLLAGESLRLDLARLEKSALDQDSRYLEITKPISLARLDPVAFLQLKTTGRCQFSLSELLFDRDFPGHYFRIIKSVSISIPAVVGPYQTIKATLTQTGHKTLLDPDIAGVHYLLGQEPTMPSSIRTDWRANQQIAISTGIEDSGVFELNFNDDRYLPFEGTGAVSTWLLEMPKATNPINFDSITDVVIHLRYMCKTDGGQFKQAVMDLDAFKTYQGARLLSLAHEFSAQWHAFKNPAANLNRLELTLPANTFPPNVSVNLNDGALSIAQIYNVGAGSTLIDVTNQFDITPPLSTNPPFTVVLTHKPKFKKSEAENLILLLNYTGKILN